MIAAKPATRNQVQVAVSESPLHLWEMARARATRAGARLAGETPALPGGAAQTRPCKPVQGKGFIVPVFTRMTLLRFAIGFRLAHPAPAAFWIPAFAGMTG